MPSLLRAGLAALAVGSGFAGAIALHAAQAQIDPSAPIVGVLTAQPAVAPTVAQQKCLDLPNTGEDTILGPHGVTRLSTDCRVIAYDTLRLPDWFAARYARTSVFTAEDTSRGREARDTVTAEEVVLFEATAAHATVPVWHTRFETGGYAIWRSVVPEVALTNDGTLLLSVMSCVNGTGGCVQAFLHRHANGRFAPVTQTWLEELPNGFFGRIRHGVSIDPQTLRGEAGFYNDDDYNCCPSHTLEVDLALRGDRLVLRHPPRTVARQRSDARLRVR
jgi:hypothetical protein